MIRRNAAAIVVIAMAALTAPAAVADEAADVAAIKAAMSALNAAFENQDAAAIRRMVTADHRSVTFYYKGPQTIDEQIASLPELKVEFYDITEPTIDMLGADAALVTFENSYRGTFQGNPVPHRVFATEIWARVDGKWREKFYQETVIAPE